MAESIYEQIIVIFLSDVLRIIRRSEFTQILRLLSRMKNRISSLDWNFLFPAEIYIETWYQWPLSHEFDGILAYIWKIPLHIPYPMLPLCYWAFPYKLPCNFAFFKTYKVFSPFGELFVEKKCFANTAMDPLVFRDSSREPAFTSIPLRNVVLE